MPREQSHDILGGKWAKTPKRNLVLLQNKFQERLHTDTVSKMNHIKNLALF